MLKEVTFWSNFTLIKVSLKGENYQVILKRPHSFLEGTMCDSSQMWNKSRIHLKEKKIELVIKEGTIVGEVVCNVVDRTR